MGEAGSTLEIDLDRLDEGLEPGEELLVHGVAAVGLEGCAVVELHNAPEFVSLGAGRDVSANPGLEQAGIWPWSLRMATITCCFRSGVTPGFQRNAKV